MSVKKLIYLLAITTTLVNCDSPIKNNNAKVEVESGTEVVVLEQAGESEEIVSRTNSSGYKIESIDDVPGFWVGYFEQDTEERYTDQSLYVDEGYMWSRENKINISIDEINGNQVKGHSVVAGNDRPFEGIFKEETDGSQPAISYTFQVSEPGDDKYDGAFIFRIENNKMVGKWEAYKEIDVKKRKYTLEKKHFRYNPDITLEHAKTYVNWEKSLEHKEEVAYDEGITEEWISREFATATEKIYKLNASNRLLTKEEVENLKKGDLTIIRNTIYARHGYSFKNRPLRVFFDAQSWYIPVHTDIRKDFTEIEKENIRLLLNYEKNAAEYYDYFGRG